MEDLEGRVAVVTGAGRGIGLAMARRFAAEGMRVVLADIDAEPLTEAERSLQRLGAETLAIQTDVSRLADVEALARSTLAAFGSIDIVCNNAGVNAAHVPAWEITQSDWEWILGPNLWGVIHGINVFVPILIEQGRHAHIVNTSSRGGLAMRAESGPYPVTKQAVLALTEALQHDLREAGSSVQASALLPGGIRTSVAMARRGQPRHARTEAEQDAEGRDMLPEEVAEVVLTGIREDRFYIMTHPESSKARVQWRADDLIEERGPTSADRSS